MNGGHAHLRIQVQDTSTGYKYRIQDTGYRIQDTGYRIQDTGYLTKKSNPIPAIPYITLKTLFIIW